MCSVHAQPRGDNWKVPRRSFLCIPRVNLTWPQLEGKKSSVYLSRKLVSSALKLWQQLETSVESPQHTEGGESRVFRGTATSGGDKARPELCNCLLLLHRAESAAN